MSSVNPTPEQMRAMVERGPEGPIVMVNLLKYRARAAYAAECPEAREGLSGRAAYQRYGAVAMRCLGEIGASIVWAGPQKLAFIGGDEQQWDEVDLRALSLAPEIPGDGLASRLFRRHLSPRCRAGAHGAVVLRGGDGVMSGYTIYGGLGSPYSMKVRAVMRYRRIPHIWRQMEVGDQGVFRNVKAPVIPIVQYPDGSWKNDSTPLIFDLEARHTGRSVVPDDPAQAFLAFLLEDFADEWGTKAMFHYRWYRERDQKQLAEWLAFDRLKGAGRQTILDAAAAFRDRQVGRMALVGCTPQNAPLIEDTARRILAIFEAYVTEEKYLFGTRPSLADFGWLGQLSQLATDPTPQEMMRADYPFTYRWLANLDDASGVEGEWRAADAPPPDAITALLKLAGEIYFPFLAANAQAVTEGKETFSVTLSGRPYGQGAFKYQVKCLAELRAAYAKLDAAVKARLDPLLLQTGCLVPLKG